MFMEYVCCLLAIHLTVFQNAATILHKSKNLLSQLVCDQSDCKKSLLVLTRGRFGERFDGSRWRELPGSTVKLDDVLGSMVAALQEEIQGHEGVQRSNVIVHDDESTASTVQNTHKSSTERHDLETNHGNPSRTIVLDCHLAKQQERRHVQ
ncbi:hypothetical protein EDD86DRAFT_207736 [Gorgonomyces haynaldii]|nr:hypothetical protein EDD86DRAFT_207736 [Gorgonomyces haynaldii]